jgi:SAM-dependent methyltransferase
VDSQADDQFHDAVRNMFGPDAMELHYVQHELDHVRHMFTTGICSADGRVLEYGCNVGATAIVLSWLGARVDAVEVNPQFLEIARLNARRYGQDIDFREITPGTALPFPDNSFDLVVCNSVLEYVPAEQLHGQQRELYRVLVPCGRILVFGTSNRLFPMERHSRSWVNNYLPIVIDRFTGRPRARGVWPWTIRYGFGPMKDVLRNMRPEPLLALKKHTGSSRNSLRILRVLSAIARTLGLSLGLLLPWLIAVLEKEKSLSVVGERTERTPDTLNGWAIGKTHGCARR